MISPTLRRAYRFYRTQVHTAQTALHLAKAERWAHDAGLYALWVVDDDADLSWMDDAELDKPHDVEGCVLVKPCQCHVDSEGYSWETYLHCSHGKATREAERAGQTCEQLASLWSIIDASREYRRVVEAELALEAMPAHPALPKAIIAEVRP